MLGKHAAAPQLWQAPLEAELVEAGAAGDRDLVTAAGELMKILDPKGSQAGKYAVNIQNAQGVQAGDGNTQTSYFGGTRVRAGRDAYNAGGDQFIKRRETGTEGRGEGAPAEWREERRQRAREAEEHPAEE